MFTLVLLAVYGPVETWYSLPALADPLYLVDLIAMVLLAAGAYRRGTLLGLSLLIAGYGWGGANFWRALFTRLDTLAAGGSLRLGGVELGFNVGGTLLMILGLGWALRTASVADHQPGAATTLPS